MHGVNKKNGELYLDDTSLSDLAISFGTPSYIYSASQIKDNFLEYKDSMRMNDKVCFAVKSNSNIAILKLLNSLGSGFDVVSGNELKRCLVAGADSKNIVFSGVGKTKEEIRLAVENNIFSINIESESELERIIEIVEEVDKKVDCAIRVNPDISAESHPYITTGLKTSKFGVTSQVALTMSKRIQEIKNINLIGLACHIGSQITKPELILDSLDHLIELANKINRESNNIKFIDIGGGLGITYKDEDSADAKDIMTRVLNKIKTFNFDLVVEPGRSITANASVLLSQVEYIKETEALNFAIVDAAMNDMLRPALYQAWMDIQPVTTTDTETKIYDVVGPVCETGDFLGKDRELAIAEGDCLCLYSAGAYGFVMSSNYNTRPRAPEIMVDGDQAHVVRARETIEDLVRGEQLLPAL